MDRKGIIDADNETRSSATRITKEGKQIRYDLHVLQQPVRARACGAGAKSSADRRPVDPPPIVELKIFDVKPNGVEDDITFIMNANYFLFATLEPARHMAQARGMPDANRPTVLTGTPVAGMVYLDRPNPAGYFIFPDLSVRHEGHFRLSFSLYEELKRTEDHDKTDELGASSSGDAHVTHRLEVKSEVLQVFSAKKFPGLTESTALSRTVAEQGCRVRIRRDVRMRRRDAKPGKDWDEYEDDTAQARARMSRTPDAPYYGPTPTAMEPIPRPRSASNTSHQSLAASISRRPSLQEMNQSYQSGPHYGGTAPHTPQNGFAPPPQYGPSPSQQFSQPPYMQQTQAMQPPPPQFATQAYQPAPSMSGATPQQQSYYSYQAQPMSQATQYAPQYETSHGSRPSGDWSSQMQPAYRRSSKQQTPAQPTQSVYAPQTSQPAYNGQTYQQQPPAQSYPPPPPQQQQPQYYASVDSRAPPEPVQPPTRATAPTPPLTMKSSFNGNILPPISQSLPRPGSEQESSSSPASAMQSNSASYFANSSLNQPSTSLSHKRSFGSTFPTAVYDQAHKSGARPDQYAPVAPQHNSAMLHADDAHDDDEDFRFGTNQYKRADGTFLFRKVMSH